MPLDGKPIEDGQLGEGDILKILNTTDDDNNDNNKDDDEPIKLPKDDDEEEENKEESGIDNDDDDEDDEDKKKKKDEEDEEDDEEEIKDDELQLLTPYRKKEILAAFPGLDKKFPFIFHAYYGYQQYTDIFPSVDDAKEAVEKGKTLDRFATEIMSGKIENVIKEVSKDDKAYRRMIDDYLPALARVNKDAATHVVSGIYKNAIASMLRFATENENEELTKAATVLHQFLFNSNKFTPHQRLSNDTELQESDKVSQERQQWQREKFESIQSDMIERMDNQIMSTINANIDTKGAMSAYIKKNAAKDAFSLLERNLIADKPFRSTMDKLWRSAIEENYSKASLGRIKKAFLSRATTLLPGVLKQARNEALKGNSKRESSGDRDRRGPLPVNRTSSAGNNSGGKTKKGDMPKGMSIDQFFMSD